MVIADIMRYGKVLSKSTKDTIGSLVQFDVLISESPEGELVRIELSVFITIILLVALLFLGSTRRFVRFGWVLRYTTKIIYMVIPFALLYIMTMMHKATRIHVLYPVWGCALIYAYGGVMTTTACSLADHDNIVSYAWRTLPLLFWTLYLAYMVYDALPQAFPIMFFAIFAGFLFVATRNTCEMLKAIYLASKSNGLPGLVAPIVQYMREARESPVDGWSFTRYRYVVWGNPFQGDGTSVTTTEDIWESVKKVGGEEERLWLMCISYAYFRLILRRFAACPLHESSQPRTRQFVYDGLMLSHFRYLPERVSERVFNVIEEELFFLYNFFYTKSFVYISYKFRDIWGPLWNAALLAIFGTVGISSMTTINSFNNNTRFHGHGLEVGVTRLVTLIFSTLEICKFVMVYFSNGRVVWLLCAPRRIRERWITERVRLGQGSLANTLNSLRPWQRKLGQYSFPESYGQVPVLARSIFTPLGRLVKLPRVGQKGEFSIALSTQVKQAIVASLLPHVGNVAVPLSRGTATMERYHLEHNITYACELETDTHVILVWHIATSFCEFFRPPQNTNDDHFLVATQLSKYCAYLVSLAPELLAGSTYTTECAFDVAVNQARRDLNGLDMYQEHQRLIKKGIFIDSDYNVIVMGAKLASALEEQVMDHPERGWKVMAEFWAELLLYLAPSDKVAAHGDYLARGGEFITHVWALLTHAGIVER